MSYKFTKYEAKTVKLNKRAIINGNLPNTARKLVKKWHGIQKEKIVKAWDNIQNDEVFEKVPPLD